MMQQRLYQKRDGEPGFAFVIHHPRAFVAMWLAFHKRNIIAVKQLVYAHKQGK